MLVLHSSVTLVYDCKFDILGKNIIFKSIFTGLFIRSLVDLRIHVTWKYTRIFWWPLILNKTFILSFNCNLILNNCTLSFLPETKLSIMYLYIVYQWAFQPTIWWSSNLKFKLSTIYVQLVMIRTKFKEKQLLSLSSKRYICWFNISTSITPLHLSHGLGVFVIALP